MRCSLIALFLVSTIPLWTQEEDRKPSPFPDKNRAREAAARKKKSSASSPSGLARVNARTRGAERTDASAIDSTAIGKACFFSSKRGSTIKASGGVANSDELVAAHATHPLGSSVIVTNLANGRAVELKITDRLPDTRRIISVSEAAAHQLGFYDAGVAKVRVELIRRDDKHP